MAFAIATLPKLSFQNLAGRPLVGGTLNTYLAGTTTPVETYADPDGTISNGTSIILDARGECVVYLDDTITYKFVLRDSLGIQIWSQDDIVATSAAISTLGGGAGASQIGFTPAGAGAVQRDLEDLGRDFYSVLNAVDRDDVDGVSSNQIGIAAAVAHCYANGLDLYWPHPGFPYVSTATIPNFHNVKHFGPGRILRGSDTFYIQPTTQTNRIYVASTGSNANDGLTAAQPKLTIQSAIDAWAVWRPQILVGGTWEISIGAGTFARGRLPDEGLRSRNILRIVGAPTAGHPAVPTTIIKEGATQTGFGLVAFSGTRLLAKDLLIEDYNGSTSSAGIIGAGAEIYTENVHVTDCYYGVSVGGAGGVANVKGGILDDCGYLNSTTAGGSAIRGLFHVKFEVGTQNSGSLANGPIIRNSSGVLLAQELCTGHFDWVTVEDNASGLRLTVNSRLNIDGSSFKRNLGSAVYATAGSYADSTASTVFGTGADANTRNYTIGTGSLVANNIISGLTLSNSADAHCFKSDYPGTVINSTSSSSTVDTQTLIGGAFAGVLASSNPAKKIECVVKCTLTGGTGLYKRVVIRLGGTGIAFASFPAAAVGAAEVRLTVHFTGTATQLITAYGVCTGQSPVIATTAGTINMAVNQDVLLQAYVENAADSITINSYEWYVQGV